MTDLRQSEVYSADRTKRLAVLKRNDGYIKISEEVLRSYASGDEWNPCLVPFPRGYIATQMVDIS